MQGFAGWGRGVGLLKRLPLMRAGSAQQARDANRFPRQVWFILGNETAERFSFYGMKGILALYITGVLMMSRDDATNIIHLFGFANYFMPLLGAWVSDRFWGRYWTILWISLFYCAGHGVLACSDFVASIDGKVACLYAGLGLIAFGSGGIKPCVSAFMGDQFRPEQAHLLQKAYAAFYWCINLGSTAAFFIVPWVRKTYGYSWAFGVPGVAMALATLVFWLGTKHYVMVPPASKTRTAGFFRVFWFAVCHRKARQPGQGFWDVALTRFSPAEVDAAKSVGPILSIFAMVPIFWALFDQTFSTWVLQGERMKPWFVTAPAWSARHIRKPDTLVEKLNQATNEVSAWVWARFSAPAKQALLQPGVGSAQRAVILAAELNRLCQADWRDELPDCSGLKLGADTQLLLRSAQQPLELQWANRLLMEDWFAEELVKSYRIGPEEMLAVNPILVMILVPLMTWLVYPRLGVWARPLRRMACGMFVGAFSFVIVAYLQVRLDAGAVLSVLWQIVPYIVLTIAEVLISTTGLEFAFREAAPSMKSIIMGFWSLTVAVGNLFVSVLTKALSGLDPSGSEGAVSTERFLLYAGLTAVVGVLFSVVAGRYRYRQPVP